MSLPRRQTPPYARVWSSPRPTGVLLLISMLGGWALAQGVLSWLDVSAMRDGLVLDGTGIRASEYWRYATYQLLQASPLHYFATALLLYLAGREVEPIVGRRHIIGMFLAANLAGGIVSWAVQPEVGVYGAAAAAAAILAAYATILPELEHRVRLFWLVPVQFRARHLLLFLFVAAAWCLHARALGEIGPAGILVGALTGWMWARFLGFGRLMWFQRAAHERDAIERRRARMSAAEFISAEVDPILEKIASHGLRSLSREERRILNRAREKIESKSV